MIYTYWVASAFIILIYLSWQDIKRDCWIDSRYNYFMFGMTASLIYVLDRNFLYCLQVILIAFIMLFLLKSVNLFGAGDIETLAWVYSGIGLISLMNLAYFFILSSAIGIVYVMSLLYLSKKDKEAYLPIIFLAFLLNSLYFKYWTF